MQHFCFSVVLPFLQVDCMFDYNQEKPKKLREMFFTFSPFRFRFLTFYPQTTYTFNTVHDSFFLVPTYPIFFSKNKINNNFITVDFLFSKHRPFFFLFPFGTS